jgi:hypothetical protein
MLNDDEVDLTNAKLFFDGNRGQYIPQDFALMIQRSMIVPTTLPAGALDALTAGPEAADYWDVWTDVLDRVLIDEPLPGGGFTRYALHQDGDLWLVPVDFE